MTMRLQSITLQGFRAYLVPQTLDLRPGKSIAVFAPNAKGKSSLVDAIDVFFSDTGSLARLGVKKSDTQAGPEALEHVLAVQKKVAPLVKLVFRDPPAKEVGDERHIKRPPAPRPNIASEILNRCKHHFIVRGHELRAFVENQTPEERYAEVSQWFGLGPLVTSQKNLRTLRKKVTELVRDEVIIEARALDISKATAGAVTKAEDADIVTWVNDVLLEALDKTIAIASLREDDSGYLQLVERRRLEDDALGLTGLEQLLAALKAVADPQGEKISGRAQDFADAVLALKYAREAEAKERGTAEKSVFAKMWEQAQYVLADSQLRIEQCPVCDTSFEVSPHRTRAAVAASISANLELLSSYNSSVTALRKAEKSAQQAHSLLKSAIQLLDGLLKAGKYDADRTELKDYFDAVSVWALTDAPPDDRSAMYTLKETTQTASDRASAIRERQGEATYAGVVAKIGEVRRIADSIRQTMLEREEFGKISDSLERVAKRIDSDIANHINSLLNGLRDEINRIYSKIQGSSGPAVKVGLEPPDPDAKGKLKLGLVVDFADNRKGVNPAGYLSDSQVHTIALSLRLAAIKLFNPSFPFVVLDDIVTSYDADHRKALVAMLAEEFANFQFVLVTHDERFFRYLKDHMPPGDWLFRQITAIETEFGPRFMEHRIADDVIESKFSKGELASNEIRQAEEEWLLGKAREFGVSVRIRDIDKPYSYDRGEIATAIAAFLKGLKMETPVLSGFANPLWTSLQAGEVENFGSHFQDNPNASASVGDEQKRWSEFKAFRALFRCKCGSARFKRPKVGVSKPLCNKCENPFAFQLPTATDSAAMQTIGAGD